MFKKVTVLLVVCSFSLFIGCPDTNDPKTPGIINYSITTTLSGANQGESITLDKESATAGETITVTANLNSGRQVSISSSEVNITPSSLTADGSTVSFIMPGSDVNLVITFSDIPVTSYSINVTTVDSIAGETVSSDLLTAPEGETVTLTATLQTERKVTLSASGVVFSADQITTSGEDSTFMMPANNVDVIATFLDYSNYIITYNANGADFGTVPAQQTKVEGTDIDIAVNSGDLGKFGHSFSGWNTERDGTGIHYNTSQTYSTDSSIILYAEWIELAQTYSITYIGNSNDIGDVPIDDNIYGSGQSALIPGNVNNLYRYGYLFNGWNTLKNGNGITFSEGDELEFIDSNITLYAKWEAPLDLSTIIDSSCYFGSSVAIDGNYAIVGSYDDDSSTHAGAVFVFHKTGVNEWNKYQKITHPDDLTGSHFGSSVAIKGDRVIIGTINSGYAYVYERIGENEWGNEFRLDPYEGSNDNFGKAVSIDDDYAIVGAEGQPQPGDSGTMWYAGSAWIFHRNSDNEWDEGVEIVPEDIAGGDGFGCSVEIFGDWALIGSYCEDNENGSDAGSVYIYKRTGENSWTFHTKLISPKTRAEEHFGKSISMYNNDVVIGIGSDVDLGYLGSAYTFHKNSYDQWNTGVELLPNGITTNNRFGRSVDMYDGRIIAGDEYDTAFLIDKTGINSWNSSFKFPEPSNSIYFSEHVGITDGYAIIGDHRKHKAWIMGH